MIRLALAIDADARAIRKRYEDEVEAPRIRGESMIADLRFELYGTDTYPDATFTLRVTYGAVEGWDENGVAVDTAIMLEALDTVYGAGWLLEELTVVD